MFWVNKRPMCVAKPIFEQLAFARDVYRIQQGSSILAGWKLFWLGFLRKTYLEPPKIRLP
jgi:hypothetical protein